MRSTKFKTIISSWDGKKRMRSRRRNKGCNYFCNDFFSFFKILQSWVFFGRTDAKAETPILWPPHGKS